MTICQPTGRPRRDRKGLAPLEFVLWLPILLMVSALFVNIGTMAAWRVRGEIVARDSVWRGRYPRNGAKEPRTPEKVWPEEAKMGTDAEAQVTEMDVAAIRHEVVRGPLPNKFKVNQILRPHQGMIAGTSEITRAYPLLARTLGEYETGVIRHPLMDNKLQNSVMGIPNKYRRTKILYELPKTDPSLPEAYINAIGELVTMPNYEDVRILDRDEEVKRYTGSYRDFHPSVGGGCEIDPEVVYEQNVKRIVDFLEDRNGDGREEVYLRAISKLPRTMTNFYLSMYKAAQANLEKQVDQMKQEQKNLQDQLDDLPERRQDLENEIDDLEDELEDLRNGGGSQDDIDDLEDELEDSQEEFDDLDEEAQEMEDRLDDIPGLIEDAEAEAASLDPKIEALEKYKARLEDIEDELERKFLEYEKSKGEGGGAAP